MGVGEMVQQGQACAKATRAVHGAHAHVTAGWGIVDEQVSTHMHADTVVCVHVRAHMLVQQEMVGLVWVGETAPHGQGGVGDGRACSLAQQWNGQVCVDVAARRVCMPMHSSDRVVKGAHVCKHHNLQFLFVHILVCLCDSGG